jgi:Zn-finger nucleic acid-binding protein
MFAGSKFCDHCGAAATAAEVTDETNLGVCPRCRINLKHLQIEAISLRECEKCGGAWSDVSTFEKICSEKEEQSAALTFFGGRQQATPTPAPINYVPCPECKQLMNRSNFAHSSGVIVDLCKEHGVWFDAGELPKIIGFIESGGLTRAREKEKIELDAERDQIRAERRQIAQSEAHSGMLTGRSSGLEIGGGDLVKALFDL